MRKVFTVFAIAMFMLSVMAIGITEAYESITATVAKAKVEASPGDTFIVDVRTLDEYYWVGTCAISGKGVPIAYNIPYELWGYKIEYDSTKDDPFTGEPIDLYKPSMVTVEKLFRLFMKKTFKPTDTVILMCRSGSRSKKAAEYLEGLGYFTTTIYEIGKGFQGGTDANGYRGWEGGSWQGDKLPMTQLLDPTKIYLYMWRPKW